MELVAEGWVLTPLAIGLAFAGGVWGVVADRISVRWPEHEDGVTARPIDWRTAVVALVGAATLGALTLRFDDPATAAIFGLVIVALVLLLATDLDQRLLPDVVTLPLIPFAAVVGILGFNPFVAGELPGAVAAAIIFPLGLFALSIPFGAGAIGMGDLKLMIGVGLLLGLYRTLLGLTAGAILSGVVVVLLLVTRRVTLRTFIPFGPFLILGAVWAIFLRL
jgi:leader peptidase (prepilin peptidase)/N-methyltransferase